ncbi:hypothetical protein Anapl_13718 [Anas platyrhynchos]|uniref:Uncharacterized protein n=1 Tax=Anas platyrhynchos TaxID=8839 RepID=R0LX96_ANAPL|nr:hypothetical protein Anapl_13718 [Anas platyrhynchos]
MIQGQGLQRHAPVTPVSGQDAFSELQFQLWLFLQLQLQSVGSMSTFAFLNNSIFKLIGFVYACYVISIFMEEEDSSEVRGAECQHLVVPLSLDSCSVNSTQADKLWQLFAQGLLAGQWDTAREAELQMRE